MSGSNQVIETHFLLEPNSNPNNLIIADSKLKLKWNCIGSCPMSQKRAAEGSEHRSIIYFRETKQLNFGKLISLVTFYLECLNYIIKVLVTFFLSYNIF